MKMKEDVILFINHPYIQYFFKEYISFFKEQLIFVNNYIMDFKYRDMNKQKS